ncbi:MAG: hypothetical protein AAF250_13600 [Pseudomonadota bacterium]
MTYRFAILVCTSAGLVGCGSEASTAALPEEIPAGSVAADGAPPEGQYRAVDEETGFVLIEELRADGTYTFADIDGNLLEQGTYLQKTPERLCFTADTELAQENCYEEAVGKDGVWRTTDPDTGAVSVVERIDDE